MIGSEKKSIGIGYAIIAYVLFSAVAYALYEVMTYLMLQIDTSNDMENVGLAAFVIAMTLVGTSVLLRLDAKHRKQVQAVSQRIQQ